MEKYIASYLIYGKGYILFYLDTKDDYDNIQTLDFDSCKESACSSISIVDDGTAEIDESFIISMERTPGMDNRILLNSETVVVTIEDDDGMSLELNTIYP